MRRFASPMFARTEPGRARGTGLPFEVVGQRLRFYVDGKLEVEAFDDTLSWGTTGIRTDYADLYFDDREHR